MQSLLSSESKTAFSAASSADAASGIANFFFFFFVSCYPMWLCVNDHHLAGFVSVIQLVL